MFYNKIFFTFIFIIISPNIFAYEIYENLGEWNKWYKANETTLVGEMSCKITDQIIIEVEEGKPKRYTPIEVEVEVKNNLMFLKSFNKPLNGIVEYYIDKTSTIKVPYKDGIQHGKKYEIFKNNFNVYHWNNGQLILSKFYHKNICYLKKIYNDNVLVLKKY